MIEQMKMGETIFNYNRYSERKIDDRQQVNTFNGVLGNKAALATSKTKNSEVEGTQSVSLESMLKAKYPNLVYNVGDGTSGDWRTRNDYPFEALFQEGQRSTELIENWKAVGPNPVNQRYLAVAPNSKAVMIHPKAQERMENDPEFAKEVMERIENWWAYDIARNEAIAPGYTKGMSQAIAIGEDGEIANVLSCGGGETIRNNKQKNNNKEEYDWWTERMARHAMYMQLWIEGRADNLISSSGFMQGNSFGNFGSMGMNGMLAVQSGQSAEQEIRNMIKNGLKEKLGDTICGIPTNEIIDTTWADIEKGRSLRMSLMMM